MSERPKTISLDPIRTTVSVLPSGNWRVCNTYTPDQAETLAAFVCDVNRSDSHGIAVTRKDTPEPFPPALPPFSPHTPHITPNPPTYPGAAATRAREPSEAVWVSEGTRAWKRWVEHRGSKSIPTTSRDIDGKRHTGWYFPSLFPPPEPALTDQSPD